ncbi:MAG: HAMP domain-containing sensor histidine kinase [Bacillota bacterium]|nr:HAMP domain-containing sensor histidine kinase [Bacillota bacterium]
MLQTLRFRILLYFLIVSLVGVLVVSFFIQYGFEQSFKSYLEVNREKEINPVLNEIEKNYKTKGTLLSDSVVVLFHTHAMYDQLYFELQGRDGKSIINLFPLNKQVNSLGLVDSSTSDEKWDFSTYNIFVNQKMVGKLIVHYPEGLINDESTFLQRIQLYIYAAVCLTIVLAILISLFFSKTLTSGLNKLSFGAKELREHNLDIRIPLKGLPSEVKNLAISFNKLAESLGKEEMLRKQFTGDLAHELRTPLATLRSQIEAFQDGIWEPTPKRLEQCHEELMRLVRLVNELEKLLAAENPQMKLEMVDLEAGAILGALWDMFMPLFTQKGVQLLKQEPLQEEWFHGDKDKIVQILTNILNNALKYTPEGKSVTISVLSEQDDYVCFLIKDEGAGMAEEDIPHIFERFYRGDKSRDRKTGGVGIGLSIVKALMDAHQGRIKVKSKINMGTSIYLWFPREE